MAHWQLGLALLGVIGYSLLSHVLMLYAAARPWAVAALLGPLLAMVLAGAWRSRHRVAMLLALMAAAGLVPVVLSGGVTDIRILYLLQHAGVHLALGVSFGLTLTGPGPSAIGRVARQLHGRLQPGMERYTQRVTLVWTVYFIAMALVSGLLFLAGPWSAWSLLANVLTPLAIALLFVGEHLLRYRLHPEFERVSLLDAARAYRTSPTVPNGNLER